MVAFFIQEKKKGHEYHSPKTKLLIKDKETHLLFQEVGRFII